MLHRTFCIRSLYRNKFLSALNVIIVEKVDNSPNNLSHNSEKSAKNMHVSFLGVADMHYFGDTNRFHFLFNVDVTLSVKMVTGVESFG